MDQSAPLAGQLRLYEERTGDVSVALDIRIWLTSEGTVEVWVSHRDALGEIWGMQQLPTAGRTTMALRRELGRFIKDFLTGPFAT